MKIFSPLSCAALLALASTLFTAPARADEVTFTGTATGYFGATPGMTTDGELSYTGSTFSQTTVGDFLSFSQSGNNFGQFTNNGTGGGVSEAFTLLLSFTSPASANQTYNAMVTGSIMFVNGGAEITYSNPLQSFAFPGGTADVNVHDISVDDDVTNQQTSSITANVAATPEPSSLALLGTGLVGLAGAVRRKLRR